MIEEYSFGRIVVNGQVYTSDIKILNDEVQTGWWREQGHRITPDDATDLLEAKPDFIVIGKGYFSRVTIGDRFRSAVRSAGIELIEEPTGQAVTVFSRLQNEGKSVAAGFHLTC